MATRPFFDLGDERTRIDWGKYSQMVTVNLREAVGLSVNLHPAGLDIVESYPLSSDNKNDPYRPAVEEFQRRLAIAKNHVSAGNLKEHYTDHSYHVVLKEFRSWAEELGWPLPDEFPGNASDGSTLRLPWRSENVDKLADELAKYGQENPLPESSTDFGLLLDRIFGWASEDNGGKPSRSAQTLASFLAPAKSRTVGLKNSKAANDTDAPDGKKARARR